MKLLFKEEIQMSTNHTQNYQLCQWEPADRVLREDFNADNAALDAALARTEATASAAKTQAQHLSDIAYTTGRMPFAAGTYLGNTQTNRVISLGFRPKFVFSAPTSLDFQYVTTMGLAIDGQMSKNIEIVSSGFQVHFVNGGGTNANMSYFYFAFR